MDIYMALSPAAFESRWLERIGDTELTFEAVLLDVKEAGLLCRWSSIKLACSIMYTYIKHIYIYIYI